MRAAISTCVMLIVSILSLSMIDRVEARVNNGKSSVVSAQNILIKKPALTDSIVGEALTGWINSGFKTVGVTGPFGKFGLTMSASPTAIPYSEGGVSYTVYALNSSPNIGFVLSVVPKDCLWIILACSWNTHDPVAITAGQNEFQTFKDGVAASGLEYNYNIKFIALSSVFIQSDVLVSPQEIATAVMCGAFGCTDTGAVTLDGFTLTYEKLGCVASFPPNIYMGVIPLDQFNGVGATVTAHSATTINLVCDDGLGVHAIMTDQNDPGSDKTTLTLTDVPNKASGIGVQFIKDDGGIVQYGPSSSVVGGGPGQWRIKSSTDSSNFSFTLMARYIQTESVVTPGEANAVASITFAYD